MSDQDNLPADDKSLLSAIRAGGEKAQQAKLDVVKKYEPLVTSVVRKILPCDHIRDEIDECRKTIIEKVAAVREPDALPAWIRTVAQHEAYHHLRKFHPVEEVSFEEGLLVSDGGMARAEEEIEAAERLAKVLALAKTITPPALAEKFVKILKLRAAGLEFDELALVLRLNPATVRTTFRRGLIKLKRLLRDESGRGGGCL